MPATWPTRIIRLLRALGLNAVRVVPGAVLVSRERRVRSHKLSRGAVLVTQPRLASRHWQEVEKRLAAYLAEQHVAALLRTYRVNCVLDVGANRGQYAKRLRRSGFAGYIVSFEPVPSTFEELQRAAADDPRWTVHPYALGREDGVTSMNVVPGTLSSVLAPTSFGSDRYSRLREPTLQDVEVRRLDGILDSVIAHVPEPRPYLKLDTQGYDLEVFAGLGERSRDFVAMQSEVALMQIYDGMPRMPDALRTYEAAGFEITALFPVSRESRTARVLEFDCVMARAESL